MKTSQFLNLLAENLGLEADEVTETSTFNEIGGMDSVSRLSMISCFESEFGPAGVFDELKTVNDVPTLLAQMRSRGLVE